jgi:hypothetical protein
MDIAIRRAKDRDANACGRICYDGFRPVNERFGFPPTFPSVEVATQRVEVEPRSSLSAYALASHFTEPSAHESLEAVCRRRQLGVSNTKH